MNFLLDFLVFLSIIVIVVIISFIVRRLSIKTFFKGREALHLEQIYADYVDSKSVDYETFRRCFEAIGKAYKIDPRLLRPDDSSGKLFDIDSWSGWRGTKRLGKVFKEEFKYASETNTTVDNTFSGLMDLLVKVKAEKSLRRGRTGKGRQLHL